MLKKTWLLLVCFTLSFSLAYGVPAKRPYEPPSAPDVIDFRETQWAGKTYEGTDWIIYFHADGGVTNTDGGNTYKRSGFWKSAGNTIHMELNNKYYEYRGVLTQDTLHGDSSNVAGLRWKTTFRRTAAPRIP